MHRLQICVFAGISFSMTGKYSDGAAREYLILLMMKRNFAGAVSSSSERGMLSCCAFAQPDLNIFVSRSWQFCRSKHQTFTHEQRQIGSDCACKQAKSGTFLDHFGAPKNAVPVLWIAKIPDIFTFS